MSISQRTRISIQKVIYYAVFMTFFGLLYGLVERGLLGDNKLYPATGNPYDFVQSIVSLIFFGPAIGMAVGVTEVFIFNKLLKGASFGRTILVKTIIYTLGLSLIIFILTFIVNSVRYKLPPWEHPVINSVIVFYSTFAFWSVLIYALTILSLGIFILEIRENIGHEVFLNMLLGKYHKPRVEERIFMFLDMKSSTTIAEKLGHTEYFKLLNRYYEIMTPAILDSRGSIYQYVGDEVIVTWPLREKKKSDPIRCYLKMKEIFEIEREGFSKNFGVVPDFRAGFHSGTTTTGEIGVVKKDVVFSGDVLNTTSRILGQCKNFDVDVLVSEDASKYMSLEKNLSWEKLGDIGLRGKEKKVGLLTIGSNLS